MPLQLWATRYVCWCASEREGGGRRERIKGWYMDVEIQNEEKEISNLW